MQNADDLHRQFRTPLPHRMQCNLVGGGVLIHPWCYICNRPFLVNGPAYPEQDICLDPDSCLEEEE